MSRVEPNFTQYRAVRVWTPEWMPPKYRVLDTSRGCNGYLRGEYHSRDEAMDAIARLAEEPATDPRPDPQTHPEYWTE